ncbi:uncharacterized protein LOC124191384 [Daphnia pulex]|uniref:uncharacterized protein LOC124191384 n=1 Tax=Daphnia pulex TaxID=6669 RepID=UPI001EDD19FE|nr:uncharacterized protein LOC124191384 [Daphnia pulex]XP_046639539.1 uncharacterized protein LOC124320712 [Daphnia pulicaria]
MEFRYLHVSTQFKLIVYTLFLLIHSSIQESAQSATNIPRYSFKEYSYVALPKYETYFQEFQSACKQNPSCQLLEGVDRLNCIRECISPSCYIELYQGDKLEVGEIDVRFESFKGCFIQRGIRRG